MPPLPHPKHNETLELPPRSGRIAGETDVLVVGGGPAGLGAALGASATGVRVILAERCGFVGGNATAAMVMPFMSFRTFSGRGKQVASTDLFPTDHGMGEPVIGGFLSLLVDRLVQAGGAIPPSTHTGFVTPFDPEIFKLVALDLLDEAGVQFLFHASASGVIGGQRLEGVIFETKSGPVVIRAKVVVDCTGDGDVAARAGAPYEVGDENGLVQPMTLMFLMREFGKEAFAEYVKSHPEQWLGVHGLWDLIRRATQAGDLEMPREDVLFFATPHRGEVSVNSTRIIKVLGTDVWDLTYAEWEGRRQVRMIADFLKKYVPGFGNSYIGQSGAHVGVRETRRILGEYQLTEEDVLNGRRFEDVIARGSYPLDFHNPTGPGTFLKPLPPGESYDIPLRCLLPRKVEQLIVAGRCLSGTQKAQSSFRTMPICMATGHAAGVCAAWSVRSGKPPREVPVQDVQQSLKQQKANLGS